MNKKEPSRLNDVLPLIRLHMRSDISGVISEKEKEFLAMKESSPEHLYAELCFCILAANTSAELGIRTQEAVGSKNFLSMEQESLRMLLKDVHYRFYNVRSRFICDNRWIAEELPVLLKSRDTWELREYLVDNLMGIGYKEASHFLRNVGIFDFAILDKHILRMLSDDKEPKKITSPSKYYEYEREILEKSSEFNLKPGILDLYLWFIATGKVIK